MPTVWKAVIIVFGLLIVGTALWTREHRLRTSAETKAEATQLQMHGQIVTNEESRRELKQTIEDLLSQNSDLKTAYDQARASTSGTKPVGSATLKTGVVRAEVPPVAPPPDRSVAPAPTVDTGRFDICILPKDSTVSFAVEEIALATDAGNHLVVGTAEVWRETPTPKYRIARAKFQSALSDSSLLQSSPAPRWGALALGACGRSGCGPGAGLLFPPVTLPFVGWRLEAFGGVIAAPNALLAVAGGGVRW